MKLLVLLCLMLVGCEDKPRVTGWWVGQPGAFTQDAGADTESDSTALYTRCVADAHDSLLQYIEAVTLIIQLDTEIETCEQDRLRVLKQLRQCRKETSHGVP